VNTETVAERVAHNEHAFRVANERIEAAAGRIPLDSELIPFLCECAVPNCTEITRLTREEYERVRDQGNTFLVAPGHEVVAVEGVTIARLVEKFERFSRMEKIGEAGEIAEQLDPRDSS
jgi:hypothetical protein